MKAMEKYVATKKLEAPTLVRPVEKCSIEWNVLDKQKTKTKSMNKLILTDYLNCGKNISAVKCIRRWKWSVARPCWKIFPDQTLPWTISMLGRHFPLCSSVRLYKKRAERKKRNKEMTSRFQDCLSSSQVLTFECVNIGSTSRMIFILVFHFQRYPERIRRHFPLIVQSIERSRRSRHFEWILRIGLGRVGHVHQWFRWNGWFGHRIIRRHSQIRVRSVSIADVLDQCTDHNAVQQSESGLVHVL